MSVPFMGVPNIQFQGGVTVLGQERGDAIPGDVAANTDIIAVQFPAGVIGPAGLLRIRGVIAVTCGAVARSTTFRMFIAGVERWNFPGVAMGANAADYGFVFNIEAYIISSTQAIFDVRWFEQTSFSPVGMGTVPMTSPTGPREGRIAQRLTNLNFGIVQEFRMTRQIIAAADVNVVTRVENITVDYISGTSPVLP